MSKHKFFFDLTILPIALLISNICFADCETRSVPNTVDSSPDIYLRIKIYSKYGGALDSFLTHAFSYGVKRKIESATKDIESTVSKTLLWTKDRGGIVDTVMIEPIDGSQPASLLSVTFLGSGGCFMDVLTEYIDSAKLIALPPDKYKISDSASFYSWVTRDSKGGLIYKPEAPGSRRPLLDAAAATGSTREALKLSLESRQYAKLVNIAQEAASQSNSSSLRSEINKSIAVIKEAEAKHIEIQEKLKSEIERSNAAAGALVWLDTLGKALSVAALSTQIQGLIASTAPPAVVNAADVAGKAGDIGTLRKTLVDWQSVETEKVNRLSGSLIEVTKQYAERRIYIIDTAKKLGAPNEAVNIK